MPFFRARVDAADKSPSAILQTPLQFARFGGACPL
ncbi:MAG: DUF2083 domain-containing protein [Hyphomicrobiaceae bacterium]|nr:DUF2083 domain-containing protein [Hyphomicrobiaceae bacterium]